MSSPAESLRPTRLSPFRIALIYFLLGSLWILLSDTLLSKAFNGAGPVLYWEIAKGLGFILVTALLLWWLCHSWYREVRDNYGKFEESRRKYTTYVEHAPIGIAVFNEQGIIVDANPAAATLTGYDREELIGSEVFRLDVSGDPGDGPAVLEQSLRQGRAVFERTLRKKDGAFAYVLLDTVALDPNHLLAFVRDISNQKKAEEELRTLNSMLSSLRRVNQAILRESTYESVTCEVGRILTEDPKFHAVWFTLHDQSGNVTHVHAAAEKPFKERLEQLLRQNELSAYRHYLDLQDGVLAAMDPIEAGPFSRAQLPEPSTRLVGTTLEYKNRHFGHMGFFLEPSVAGNPEELDLLRELGDDIAHALHSLSLERTRAKAVESLIDAKRQAERANRAKDEFLALMSHEMRTPLNPILGHCELLHEEIENPEHQSALHEIEVAGRKLLRLIDEILYFTRLQRGEEVASPVSFNPLELCRKTLDQTAPQKTGPQWRLENGGPGLDAIEAKHEIAADWKMLQFLVRELLANAFKFTESGSVILRTGFLPEEEWSPERTFVLEVEDTGTGISEQDEEDLFEPFTQSDASFSRSYEGLGLGLATCRKITDLLGGTLTARSRPDRGSVFTFRCPFPTRSRAPAGGDCCNGITEVEEPTTESKQPPLSREPGENAPSILIVEDHPSNAMVARVIVERTGFRAVVAENAEEAIERCKSGKFSLILMDISLPGMSGTEAAHEILEAESPNRNTPIIALTAYATDEARAECLRCGMEAHIAKPIRVRELQDVIRKFASCSESS